MSRVMILGDIHGDLRDVERVLQTCARVGLDHVLQLGDWGVCWRDVSRVRSLHKLLNKYAMTMDFIDGNHEDHRLLARLGATHDAPGPVELSSRVRYIPRGHVWEWEGLTCLALGGASSIDKPNRISGVSWFPEELISEPDVERSIANAAGRKVDVMFTHEAPDSHVLYSFLAKSEHLWDLQELAVSTANRERLNRVVDTIKPTMLIHGHYHWAYTASRGSTLVRGLDLARLNQAMYVLDSDDFASEVSDWFSDWSCG